jgi:hypothetical protein
MKPIYFIKYILAALLFVSVGVHAQPSKNWDQEKIIGHRYYFPESYKGSPYFVRSWQEGSVSFTSGQVVNGLLLKYDGHIDELIYINDVYHTMVKIEKPTVKSFQFNFQGTEYYFERRNFEGWIKGDRYFQVLHKGKVDLLCLRQVRLIPTSLYWDSAGHMKNMEYVPSFRYFLYKKGEGYHFTSLKKKSLLSYFSGAQKKQVNQLIRKNHIRFKTEYGFAQALKILEENHIDPEL